MFKPLLPHLYWACAEKVSALSLFVIEGSESFLWPSGCGLGLCCNQGWFRLRPLGENVILITFHWSKHIKYFPFLMDFAAVWKFQWWAEGFIFYLLVSFCVFGSHMHLMDCGHMILLLGGVIFFALCPLSGKWWFYSWCLMIFFKYDAILSNCIEFEYNYPIISEEYYST